MSRVIAGLALVLVIAGAGIRADTPVSASPVPASGEERSLRNTASAPERRRAYDVYDDQGNLAAIVDPDGPFVYEPRKSGR